MINLSSSQIEYLRSIYIISRESKVSVTKISEYLNYSKPSVVRGLKKLADLGLVLYNEDKIELTEKGKKYAHNIMRKSDIINMFFKDILGIDEKQAKEDAKKIKDVVSCYTITKLEEYVEKVLKEKITTYDDYCICDKECSICSKDK